jgi:hypothetical protein
MISSFLFVLLSLLSTTTAVADNDLVRLHSSEVPFDFIQCFDKTCPQATFVALPSASFQMVIPEIFALHESFEYTLPKCLPNFVHACL